MVKNASTQSVYKIRVRLKSYDHRVIDEASRKILQTALSTGAKVVGPVPLPTHTKSFTVLTSPNADKNAQEHYEIRTHKRLIEIVNPTNKTIDSLMHLELPAGVDIQIKM
ncbi:MAG: 30S ribosomal protein S10 [Candidatus Paceibacterota bacterium]|nr:MAG: 30S ribosomal protein S10 [Candidatus Pacebacteria bacterium RIFOXYB1_FULL_39_46]OGJ39002.1 MAG: 30S ribosomal protein S10 [Candidatus Pacebacteria bacterium RIFOXYA1_FULL_38_18]OGJ39973.1 MAG: 30S ribosomal protein S10 [Candidatus Pacebacteria bacterium RIFOXYD1_FULL_39_27]OGJ40765.1 MAG: 30S ribosomal protein S10 [Candidatus Pacebacteria bacterium RIFOXYC1_FULL_39_21]